MTMQERKQLMDAMNKCRQKLDRLMMEKDMQIDQELINISEEMDQLILAYYEWMKKRT